MYCDTLTGPIGPFQGTSVTGAGVNTAVLGTEYYRSPAVRGSEPATISHGWRR